MVADLSRLRLLHSPSVHLKQAPAQTGYKAAKITDGWLFWHKVRAWGHHHSVVIVCDFFFSLLLIKVISVQLKHFKVWKSMSVAALLWERPNEDVCASWRRKSQAAEGRWDSFSQHASVLMMPRQLMNVVRRVLVVNKAEGDMEEVLPIQN